jgi:hypothetical protein
MVSEWNLLDIRKPNPGVVQAGAVPVGAPRGSYIAHILPFKPIFRRPVVFVPVALAPGPNENDVALSITIDVGKTNVLSTPVRLVEYYTILSPVGGVQNVAEECYLAVYTYVHIVVS